MKLEIGSTYCTMNGIEVTIIGVLEVRWASPMWVREYGDGCAWLENGKCVAFQRKSGLLTDYDLRPPEENLENLL